MPSPPRDLSADLPSNVGATLAAPEALANSPSDESTMVDAGAAKDSGASTAAGSTASGPESPLQAVALAQTRLIGSDSLRSETQVSAIATAHRRQISGQFGGVRGRLLALFNQSSAGVQSFIAGKQAEVRTATASMLKSAQSLVTSTVQAAEAQADRARETISSFVEGVAASLQDKVQGIAAQITGVIDRVPIPDIPGVAQLRAAAASLVGRAAGAVTGGLSQVRSLISSALQAGMQLLSSVLANLQQLANAALTQVAAGIQRGVQMVFQSLSQTASLIISALRTVVSGTVLPMVSRLEGQSLQALGTAQQQAIAAIRSNREEHLKALASALHPTAGGGAGPARSASAGGGAEALQAIGQEALQNNRMIVQTFDARTASILGLIFQALTGGAARVVQQIGGAITAATSAVLAKVQAIMQSIGQLAEAVGSFLQSLLQALGSALAGVAQSVRALVQDPVDQLLQFAQGALSRITQFVGQFIRNLLSGNISIPSIADVIGVFRPTTAGGPITKPRPPGGPITLPGLERLIIILAAVGALILFAVPALAVVVTALIELGLSPLVALAVFAVLVIVALILLLLLIYLLYRLLKPHPKPPGPPDPKITHETVFKAPDGSSKTRSDIGVGEHVVFVGNAAGTWTASAGSPRSASGTTFTWIAPERTATVTITLLVGGKSSSVSMSVLEPNDIKAIKLSEDIYPAGTQGAGMKLNFSFHPLNVSFGNAETREVAGPASNIKGYYRKHGMPHDHNPGPVRFFRICEDNKFLAAADHAAQSGYPAPWGKGSFHWKIPNKFRVFTEGGDGKKYTDVIQGFTMKGRSGRTKVTKAGEKVERAP